jgi:hypothetical protein
MMCVIFWLVKIPVFWFLFLFSARRKGDKHQSQSENLIDNESQMELQIAQPKARKKVTKSSFDLDDDGAISPPVRASRDKFLPQKKDCWTSWKGYKEIPLFIDLDDEENRGENMNVDPTGNGVDEEPTLQSSFEN